MRSPLCPPVLGLVLAFAIATLPSFAQVPAAASTNGSLTAKERLAEKWTDEQRVDNCKVPPDKRGPKPRPDACSNRIAGPSP